MRKISTMLAAAALAVVAATPALAAPAANPASKLSIARASAPMKNASRLNSDSGPVITALAIVAATVLAVVLVDGHDDQPVSA